VSLCMLVSALCEGCKVVPTALQLSYSASLLITAAELTVWCEPLGVCTILKNAVTFRVSSSKRINGLFIKLERAGRAAAMGYKSRWLSFMKAKSAEVEKPGVEDSTRSDTTATTVVCSTLEFDSDESPQRSRTQTITGGFTVQHTSHTSQVVIEA
jgi:hypothetical protein